MRTCIIFNPTARGDKARRFRAALQSIAAAVEVKPTTGPDTAPAIATNAVREGFDVIVAAGGDGTVNEVVNGLMASGTGLARCRLGVIPLGTVNVFAKELGLPGRVTAAWRVVTAGKETRLDLPWVEWEEAGLAHRRAFVQLAGTGLDSRSIALVNWELKKKFGPLAYVWAGLAAMRGPQPKIRVIADGQDVTGELVLVGNGRYYGGYIPMFPGADLRDGQLEVRVFPRVCWSALVGFGVRWLTRNPGIPAGQTYFRASKLELRSVPPIPFELDGDNVARLPAKFGVERQVLRVLVP
ncbi:MAG: diacylglycerol/lipid kinase family protein [Limisphaerales bacterium]